MTVMKILMVCTANVCRSPVMEAALRDGVGTFDGIGVDDVVVTSAGIAGHEGSAADPHMVAAAARRGIDISGSVGTEFGSAQTVDADLVLAATRSHRAAIVRRDPLCRDRCFTYLEFARFCAVAPPQPGEDPAKRLDGLIAFALEQRGTLHPAKAADDDLPDPHGRRGSIYRRSVQNIVTGAEQILGAVARR